MPDDGKDHDPPEMQALRGDPDHAFDGKTYNAPRDYIRLRGQLLRTWQVMLDGRERTLSMIAGETSDRRLDGGRDSEAAVSARLRDFRKDKFGSHIVVAYNGGGSLWWYKLVPNTLKLEEPRQKDMFDI